MKKLQEHPQLLFLSFVLAFAAFFQGTGSAQDSAIETLKRQLGEMRQQMQKMAERIEHLEREKASEAATSSRAEAVPAKDGPQVAGQPPAAKGISSAFNPAISVNGLFLGGYSSSPRTTSRLTGLDFHNGFNLQEAEFQFTADVDPYWKANFILGVDRNGETEVEEGYVTSEELPYDLMPRNTSLKLGKFFASFGKQNLLHAHQFPFIYPPFINQSIFFS